MLALSLRPKVYVCLKATDMRCSFRGLIARTKQLIKQDPLSGCLFVFFNKRKDYIKILYWDESGYCIWSKRLERGTFEVPRTQTIDVKKLMLVLEGISLKNVNERKRFLLKK